MSQSAVTARFLEANRAVAGRYLTGLNESDYTHQPFPGVNSVAWILGHLILTERQALAALGEVNLPPLPEGFEARFATTGQPAADQSHLTGGPDLLARFHEHRELLIQAVKSSTDEQLATPLQKPSPLYQTRGELAAFMAQHVAIHLGQITLIRRSLGMPPVV